MAAPAHRMARSRPRWAGLLLLTIFTAVAFVAYSWPRPWATYRLPSGQSVTHLILGHFVTTAGPVLRLRYETELPLDDTTALRRQARELWPAFRAKLERGGYHRGAFYPETKPTGVCYRYQGLCRYRGFGFPLGKNQDGRWYFEDTDEVLP
jgi:hypothetical protein